MMALIEGLLAVMGIILVVGIAGAFAALLGWCVWWVWWYVFTYLFGPGLIDRPPFWTKPDPQRRSGWTYRDAEGRLYDTPPEGVAVAKVPWRRCKDCNIKMIAKDRQFSNFHSDGKCDACTSDPESTWAYH